MNAQLSSGDGRLGRARVPRNPVSLAGLFAILFVMAGSHVVVARYDMLALDVLESDCIFVGGAATNDECEVDAAPSPGGSGASSVEPSEVTTGSPSAVPSAVGSALPEVEIPPWNGTEQLNILLIGTDQRPNEGFYNTDTLIVVSIDPVSKQVAMFSLPRDTVDIPVPEGPARRFFGRVYEGKVNSFFSTVRNREDLFPGTNKTRGYNGLKALMGELYGLDVRYFVEVNFEGFKSVVDALGGVTINVQIPISDDRFPADRGKLERVYIPTGIQHMDGAQALRFARSRHSSTDFDRGQRQQRVLLSMREQADPQELIPRLPELVQALKKAVRTDIPVDQLDEMLGLASQVDTKDIRSYVFAPPLYQDEILSGEPRGYVIIPYLDKIRSAVRSAFTADPALEAQREKLAGEGATVWVLNGTSDRDRGATLAGYLEFEGLAASSPRQKPEGAVPSDTKLVVYNGAETRLAETVAYLETTFGVKATRKDDPAIRADVTVTVGRDTPELEAPVGP